MDYAVLKTEIDKPAYAGKTDPEVADMLNAPGPDTAPGGIINARRVLRVPTGAELINLTAAKRSLLQLILSPGEVNIGSDNIQAVLADCFPGATATAFAALKTKSISKAEALGLRRVRHGDVAEARRLGA
jgi:hypothetical protein